MLSHELSEDSSRKRFLDDLNKMSILSGKDCDDALSIDSQSRSTEATQTSKPDAIKASVKQSYFFTILVALMGVVSAAMFMSFGITAAVEKAEQDLHHVGEEMSLQLLAAWDDYEMGLRWLHQACYNKNVSREDFRDLYEYISHSLDVQLIIWAPLSTHEQRASLEEESAQFLSMNYPDIVYHGFQEFYMDPSQEFGFSSKKSPDEATYYPAHFMEPMTERISLLDLNLNSSSNPSVAELVAALETGKPTVSLPLRIPGGFGLDSTHNILAMYHPGIPLESEPAFLPRNVALLLVSMDMLSKRMTAGIPPYGVSVYLFDDREASEETTMFLIGVDLSKTPSDTDYFRPEVTLQELLSSKGSLMQHELVKVASSQWHVVVIALEGEYEPSTTPVVVAGISMVVACFSVSFWIWWDSKRNRKIQLIGRKAEAEKAAVKLHSAQDRARAEQELNDYIAHEIRNPLAAAMSACSFVKSAVNETPPMCEKESQESVREDVGIIDSSLTFINDLLRSMLDMHKAESMKMDINLSPADLKRDILEPVAAMLYQRDSNFTVEIDCPENLIVSTDKLRLKQVVINLGRNSSKFVERGFIRFVATVVHHRIRIYVEDSGPGIPNEKRANLFNKFQDSLDVLEQGTGMGLCLCKNLTELLGGDIWLDESYDSGLFDCPGSRFVIDTNSPPMSIEECQEFLLSTEAFEDEKKDTLRRLIRESGNLSHPLVAESKEAIELPADFSVLFVDDDMVLRKLFGRSVKKVVDTWDIKEAANGEAAIQMLKTRSFDLIFVDQYMSSAEKTLLGTETVRALRSQGVKSRICGLSANDMERQFLAAGADFFLQKPFPCKSDELRRALIRIGFSDRSSSYMSEEDKASARTKVAAQCDEKSDSS